MVYKSGLTANQTPNPEVLSGGIKEFSDIKTNMDTSVRYGRVVDVILSSNYTSFSEVGGSSAIGNIIFEDIYNQGTTEPAIPLFPQINTPPLVNELVLIFAFPSKNLFSDNKSKDYYYLTPVNIWNNAHCNPIPSSFKKTTKNQKSYQEIEAGSPINSDVEDLKTEEPRGVSKETQQINTFVERTATDENFIFPLLPFAGDTIFQGRWGNSIRLGSTAFSPNIVGAGENNWSDVGEEGSPIILISNGQNPNLQEGSFKKRAVEDINFDLSSLYLTSTQNIPLNPSNQNYVPSYNDEVPSTPNTYFKPQAIINSGRLVFNSKDDHTLVSSNKSIFLGANTSVNISTRETIVNSRNIRLGSKEAKEPIIKGEIFLNSLSLIMNELSVVCSVLRNLQEVTTVDVNSGKPIKAAALKGNLRSKCNNLEDMIKDFVENMDTYKSKVNKII